MTYDETLIPGKNGERAKDSDHSEINAQSRQIMTRENDYVVDALIKLKEGELSLEEVENIIEEGAVL